MTTSPPPDRVTAIYDAIDAFQRQYRTVGALAHAQIRASLAEYLDRVLPAAAPMPSRPDQPALRARIAAAFRVHYHCPGDLDPDGPIPCACGWTDPGPDATHETDFDAHMADVVLGVLAADTQPSEELAKQITRAIFALKSPPPPGSQHYRAGWDDGLEAAMDAARDEVLRRLAAETQQTQTETRPRCPHCGLPHDLTPSMQLTCASIRASLADADRRHAEGDHGGCARVNCEVLRERDRDAAAPAVPVEAAADDEETQVATHSCGQIPHTWGCVTSYGPRTEEPKS